MLQPTHAGIHLDSCPYMHTHTSNQPTCCRYETAKQQAETLRNHSLEHLHHQTAVDSDRGHITTILEHNDTKHPLSDQAQPSFIDTARSMLDEYTNSQELAQADSMSSQRNLPRVKIPSRTADHAAQVAIAGNRQNSLPDLTSRRAPRPRAAAPRKNSLGPVRLDSQARWPTSSDFCLYPFLQERLLFLLICC